MPRGSSIPGPYQLDTAARIKSERTRLGLSQAEAARRLGIPRPSYQLLERHANPLLGTMTDLVEVLGMDPTVLFPRLMPRRRKGRVASNAGGPP
jgi:transcriptional regulator with XRE-family HTH domain